MCLIFIGDLNFKVDKNSDKKVVILFLFFILGNMIRDCRIIIIGFWMK